VVLFQLAKVLHDFVHAMKGAPKLREIAEVGAIPQDNML
jgi:hypothetical protein